MAAAPVYRLFGETAPFANAVIPAPAGTSLLINHHGYFTRDGPHTVLSEGWKLFIDYIQKYL